VLGAHVAQKGSLVAPDRLRFDFSHFSPMTDEQKRAVEDWVNREVRANHESRTDVLALEEARQRGAVAMFGEKYGERVRVVNIGSESLEFCGGTHVRRSGDIALFKIVGEAGIAQGVRRIEAVTGAGALAYLQAIEEQLGAARASLASAQKEARKLEAENQKLKLQLVFNPKADLLDGMETVNDVKVLVKQVDVADPEALRDHGDKVRDKMGSGVIVLAGVAGEKISLLAMVTKDLTKRFHAGKLVGAIAEVVGGKGGGRPDLAQAGGRDVSKVDEALRKARELIGQQ
jgi:alanyl-tRNA synthetase